jgi:hypothetical protein
MSLVIPFELKTPAYEIVTGRGNAGFIIECTVRSRHPYEDHAVWQKYKTIVYSENSQDADFLREALVPGTLALVTAPNACVVMNDFGEPVIHLQFAKLNKPYFLNERQQSRPVHEIKNKPRTEVIYSSKERERQIQHGRKQNDRNY